MLCVALPDFGERIPSIDELATVGLFASDSDLFSQLGQPHFSTSSSPTK
jgi:hypothetical protein